MLDFLPATRLRSTEKKKLFLVPSTLLLLIFRILHHVPRYHVLSVLSKFEGVLLIPRKIDGGKKRYMGGEGYMDDQHLLYV